MAKNKTTIHIRRKPFAETFCGLKADAHARLKGRKAVDFPNMANCRNCIKALKRDQSIKDAEEHRIS